MQKLISMVLLKVRIQKSKRRCSPGHNVEYLSAIEETKFTIAQANTKIR